ncbi:hypothetical protein J0X19_03190 [Hymenobacter sp. BT186]|uniref:Uncharacterized protein n=1 Tax=Hymenobacter telluris TaxID=2816474 RepID=A0A939ESF5_9BACT|nr:hypothetical protein [Hymenobacter telluris]MBO0356939.1 hypothetical protein [Hymenobacter telluris]MBW3372966.1 hypothetical protein [Hymenobacter norwichensis]
MSVLLHASTQPSLPAHNQTVSADRTRSIELWLLTAFLFSLLIVGRLTSRTAASAQLSQLPTHSSLLRNITPIRPGTPNGPVPFFEPTAFYLPALTTTIQ